MVTKNFARFAVALTNISEGNSLYFKLMIKNTSGVIDHFTQEEFYPNDNVRFTYSPALFHKIGLRVYPMKGTNQANSSSGMFFGNGTTPATQEDYNLENLIEYSATGLTVISTSLEQIVNENTLYVYTWIVQNNGSEPITISESALISSVFYPAVNKVVTFLWARDTFEPVTLQPRETRAFTMMIGLE